MENELKLQKLQSDFFFDKQGVIVKVQLEADYVFRGALFYDGRNQAILGRNNKDFYLFKSIAPIIRKKIKNAKTVTVMECTADKVNQAYDVEVVMVDEIPGEDTFEEDYQKYFAKLEKMYGTERVQTFKQKALAAWRKFIS
ncbi:MAG: hypothetical protein IJ870_05745 [Alphaproteobacteria bacterium]|nr:hypothetical protein [Alphaproteobacteria bacterium]